MSKNELLELIDSVKAAKPSGRNPLIAHAVIWKNELSFHPERFRLENGELLWLGLKVITTGFQEQQNSFWDLVNEYINEGVI